MYCFGIFGSTVKASPELKRTPKIGEEEEGLGFFTSDMLQEMLHRILLNKNVDGIGEFYLVLKHIITHKQLFPSAPTLPVEPGMLIIAQLTHCELELKTAGEVVSQSHAFVLEFHL